MLPPRLIIAEPRSDWAAAFRQQFGAETPLIEETRSTEMCLAAIDVAPDSIAAVALQTDNLADGLTLLALIDANYPAARSVALVDGQCEPYIALARELGALIAAKGRRQLHEAMSVVRNHLACAAESRALTINESTQDRLEPRLPSI